MLICKIRNRTYETEYLGGEIKRVTTPGVLLNDGDRVQTKQGDAEILFSDGAIMKVNPFSNAMVQEMQEQDGDHKEGRISGSAPLFSFIPTSIPSRTVCFDYLDARLSSLYNRAAENDFRSGVPHYERFES